jgi:hypothetical protein
MRTLIIAMALLATGCVHDVRPTGAQYVAPPDTAQLRRGLLTMAAAMNGGQSPQEQAYREQQRFYRAQQQQLDRIQRDLRYMRTHHR